MSIRGLLAGLLVSLSLGGTAASAGEFIEIKFHRSGARVLAADDCSALNGDQSLRQTRG